MRRSNLGLVLREVLSAPHPVSRADVAASTGLTRATVSSLVESLLAADLVTELEPVAPQGAGRPAVPLGPARQTVAALGLVVNVDYLGVRALDLAGDVLAERFETGDFRDSAPAPVLSQAAALVASVVSDLGDGPRLAGLGIAVPGLVAAGTRRLRIAPNLGWRDVDLGDLLAGTLLAGLPVEVENEANLAARAELHARRGDVEDFVYVNGEVGVGGALVQGGEVFVGPDGGAGEIGHVTVDAAGPECRCGATGCLEAFAGMDAMRHAAGLPPDAGITELRERAAAGSGDARSAVDRAGRALGVALASTLNAVAMHRVVLAGNFAVLADLVRAPVEAELRRRVLLAPWSPPLVEVALVDDHPAVTGAALTALAGLVADPAAWTDA
ncbi:MAG TPA: ROK family protein [Egicoccus sp.]|nr:ROK family protein [Egicoccus sp.]HSK23190.1 ROK family protein [Egicoccus sp.]